MPLSYLPAGRRGFVPRPCGFGARLLGADPDAARTDAADAIVATRQERDLLRSDLTLVGADGALLPEALGCGLQRAADRSLRVATAAPVEPDDWDLLELGDPGDHPALAAALAVVGALHREGGVGVLLTGPLALAEQVAGAAIAPGDDAYEGLVDACGMAVRDAAKAVLDAGGHVVLQERRGPDPGELALCAPLLNLLAHHRRPALVLVEQRTAGAYGDGSQAIGAVATGEALPDWDEPWDAGGDVPVVSPRIPADASPERVQELVLGFRAATS